MIKEVVEGLSLRKFHDDQRIICAQIGWWSTAGADKSSVPKLHDNQRIISA